jgi:hypothetical protein
LLRLTFIAFDNRSGDEVSADAFTLHHGNLEAWPEGRLIARHVDNQWQVDGRTFVRFECRPRVSCFFETAADVAERHGPFDSLTCVDGVLWVGADAIAALRNGHWSSMSTKKAWPRLRLAFTRL